MAVEIRIPSVGESITQVVVAQWMKETGSFVKKDEPIVELETDKVNQELAAPDTGILRIAVNEGETVGIGAVIGSIEPGVENAAKADGPAAPPDAKAPAAAEAKPAPAPPAAATEEHKATSLARKVAADQGVNLEALTGSGPGGRIVREDVLAAAAPKPSPAAAPAPAPAATPSHQPAAAGSRAVTRERMSQLRKRVAARLVEAQHTAAMLTTFNEVDMTAVMEARAKYKDAFAKKHGIGLGFMSFFVKAVIEGLREFPRLNAFIEGDEIVYHHYHDVGVAVGTERGLVVPVLRNVEALSFSGIEKAIRDYAEKAKTGKLTIDDLSGGTFTISNGGVYGSMMSTPILNPPQSGILGMHNILKRPVAIDDKVEIRPMMYIALSYDHRIVDGKEAVGFLVRVKQCIESPERMLLEV